jgi:hypothetical protein
VISVGLGEIFEGDFAEICSQEQKKTSACAGPRAKNPIGTSENLKKGIYQMIYDLSMKT